MESSPGFWVSCRPSSKNGLRQRLGEAAYSGIRRLRLFFPEKHNPEEDRDAKENEGYILRNAHSSSESRGFVRTNDFEDESADWVKGQEHEESLSVSAHSRTVGVRAEF